ncbi:hypothetical protein CCACVL1_06233 [Corchorus capsularis]|uniref:Uncharacterized protein n=1 Tax=Corchorus capsularis TaxID=210143 RepID=A0A1R3JGM2_COCAP|nr:hypothetical protein CCACVL1_06233 [Corchorus capsularis]
MAVGCRFGPTNQPKPPTSFKWFTDRRFRSVQTANCSALVETNQ